MEKLKGLGELLLAVERYEAIGVRDPKSGEWVSLSLERHHEFVASIQLHAGVPAEIRSSFATAQNILVYTWFVYAFS